MGGPLLAAAVVVVVSTAGYVVLAGLPWFDALYMTFITVGTVGFSEIGELGTAGRAWTMAVIFAGYAVLVVMTARLTAMLLSGAWAELLSARRRQRLMTTLEGHTIIVGFGRVGEATAESFVGAGRACAVIDIDRARAPAVEELGAVPVIGDARDAEVLQLAGLERAAAVVGTLSDIDNLVMVSSVRALRPDVRIVVRVTDTDWCERLRRAGADDLVPIYRTAGHHLALSATTSGVVGVMDSPNGLVTREIEVSHGSGLVGLSPSEIMRRDPMMIVVGIRNDGGVTRWHEFEGPIREGDVLIVAGTPDG
jgi:voltage-gated potassium channel